MNRKKWRVTKRDGKWVATSPPLRNAPAYPSGCCIARSFPTWDDAMAYADNWIEGERAENRRKGIRLANEAIRGIRRILP